MNDKTKTAIQEFEQMLLKGTKYTGNQESYKKVFSASMLGNDPLQNYLKYMYGGKDSTQFEANTFGSVYQLGVDMAADKWNSMNSPEMQYINALRLQSKLEGTDWIISGEMDQLDMKNYVIFDNKVTTATTLGKIKSEGKNHSYALQLGVYKWLLYQDEVNRGIKPNEYTGVLAVVDKGFSYFKTNKYNQLTFVEVETYSVEDIGVMLKETIDTLQDYIDLEQEPGECKNKFPYKAKGQKVAKPMRCIHYCDFAEHCKYFRTDGPAAIKELLDL